MIQPWRLPRGGRIDRSRTLRFTFDGRSYEGHPGDTLASALLANGVRLVGRSFKYHRPRGIVTAGSEEPNALVTLRRGARSEPNTRATLVELFDGLEAVSQNRWPGLRLDLMAVNSLLAPLFPAGFYYKTFMGPGDAWMHWERLIRRAGGLGQAPVEPDPDRYEKAHAFCDLLVVGGGPAGLSAALQAGRAGLRVIICDEGAELGGALLFEPLDHAWLDETLAALKAMPDVTLMPRTTAFGLYDHLVAGLVERVADHLPEPETGLPRQRFWKVRARRILLAAGAVERPIVFADNDRPGVMQASAARNYVNRYGVLPGARAVVFATNDSAYAAAHDITEAGIEIAAFVDARTEPPAALVEGMKERGIPLMPGRAVVRTRGSRKVSEAFIGRLDDAGRLVDGDVEHVDCDLVLTSGGWDPALQLWSQICGRPEWHEGLQAFVPGTSRPGIDTAGAIQGHAETDACKRAGLAAGRAACKALGVSRGRVAAPPALPDGSIRPPWAVPAKRGKAFVDLQDDVTVADIELAHREGYASVEHLKRYTTLGMGTDQGRTSNVNGLAIMARCRGVPIPDVGTTTYRPPFTPVALGALAGREVGPHFQPVRRTPMHDWHARNGAVFADAGLWKRPRYYPRPGESLRDAYVREARHVRAKVGLVDVSTLGKIDIQGPDALELLNRVYANGWSSLAIGRCRYGLMLREDGICFDDGTTSRIGETHYFMTTTTANAAAVLSHLEYCLEVLWPDLRVHVTSVTDASAAMALAGPRSRDVLAAIVDTDVSDAALPHMGVAHGRIGDVPVRILRVSFSGERAFEIYVPASHGEVVWEAVLSAGRAFDIAVYGTEAMGALRIEKGHVAGEDLDGRTTPADLGLAQLARPTKPFIGRAMMDRDAFREPGRPALAGLVSRAGPIRAGAILVAEDAHRSGLGKLGRVTSVTYSPALGKEIALGFVLDAERRRGHVLHATSPLHGEHTPVEVVAPCFLDPAGERMRG